MQSSRRMIAVVLVAAFLFGLLPSSVLAQAPVPPSPPAVVEIAPSEPAASRGADIYDVGAGVVTVARWPFNVALCGLGGILGTSIFLLTFGSAYKASTRTIEEGCAQRWIVRGEDLRPRGGAPGLFPDRSSDVYQNRH